MILKSGLGSAGQFLCCSCQWSLIWLHVFGVAGGADLSWDTEMAGSSLSKIISGPLSLHMVSRYKEKVKVQHSLCVVSPAG